MEKYVQDIRLQEWSKIIAAANESGIPRMQWLEENNITKDTFYYWLKKVRKYWAEQQGLVPASKDEPNNNKLVEVPVAKATAKRMEDQPAAIIRIGSMSIEISSVATPEFMEGLGRMIRNAL